jgi:hypothetical protein
MRGRRRPQPCQPCWTQGAAGIRVLPGVPRRPAPMGRRRSRTPISSPWASNRGGDRRDPPACRPSRSAGARPSCWTTARRAAGDGAAPQPRQCPARERLEADFAAEPLGGALARTIYYSIGRGARISAGSLPHLCFAVLHDEPRGEIGLKRRWFSGKSSKRTRASPLARNDSNHYLY